MTNEPAVGDRIKRYRLEKGLRLTELAEKASVSKGYLSTLENGGSGRISGEKLYAIASALGVTMSDLLGEKLIVEKKAATVPAVLREFADEHNLPEADVLMLSQIEFRGGQPQTKERWAHIYSAIRSSKWMDDDATETD